MCVMIELSFGLCGCGFEYWSPCLEDPCADVDDHEKHRPFDYCGVRHDAFGNEALKSYEYHWLEVINDCWYSLTAGDRPV